MAHQKIHHSTIQRPSFRSPVDIIIPYHGQYDKVTRLVEGILRYTYSNVYNLCLVDDNSANHTFIDGLSRTRMVKPLTVQCIRCKEQRGFAGALQVGFKATKHPWVVFLNSDCVVEDINWLQSLGEAALRMKEQNVRMVAPRTNNALNGHPAQQGEREDITEDVVVEDGHLSMYAFICHRELFSHVGGFLKSYPYGYYEDEEFAFRLRHYGFKQGVAGSAWIYHEGESTVKELWRRDRRIPKIMMEDNRDKCIADMKSLLATSPPVTSNLDVVKNQEATLNTVA